MVAVIGIVALAFATPLFADDADSKEKMDKDKIMGEVVAVDLDQGMISLKKVRKDPDAPEEAQVEESDLPDKMVIYVDEDTLIMDDGKRTALGELHENDILHVTYVDKEGKSWAESVDRQKKK
jgi:hypothetical protein